MTNRDPQKDGGFAFPLMPPCDASGQSAQGYPYPENGMTLRDWFAGQAVSGLLAEPQPEDGEPDLGLGRDYAANAAQAAYRIADAMLAERSKP